MRAAGIAVAHALLACTCLLGCGARERAAERSQPRVVLASQPSAVGPSAARAATGGTLLALFELPREQRTATLSGAYYDAPSRTLHLVQDRRPELVPLIASADFRSFTLGTPLLLQGRPDSTWDGEGVARGGDELYVVAIETAARIERFDRAGKYLGTLALPARFAEHAASNKGLESLSVAPSGRVLFTANEAALETDGPRASASAGTLVRIVRKRLGPDAQRQDAQHPDEQRAYRTEPVGAGQGGGMGVSDLAALSDDELLVLERGYQPGYGNTVRIFRTDLRSAPDVSQRDALGADGPVLTKTLVVDLATLPTEGVSHHGPQPNPLLENYESLALGPTRPDGTRVVLLVSDDNASADQRPRVLVLALSL